MEGEINVYTNKRDFLSENATKMEKCFEHCKCVKYIPNKDATSKIGTIEVVKDEPCEDTLQRTLEIALEKAWEMDFCLDGRIFFHDPGHTLDSVAFFECCRSTSVLRVVSVKEKLKQMEEEMELLKEELFFATMQNSTYRNFFSNLKFSVANMAQNEETAADLKRMAMLKRQKIN